MEFCSEERLELSKDIPLTLFLSSTPINSVPPAALAKAHTSSVISLTFEGKFTLNSALYPSPEEMMDFSSITVRIYSTIILFIKNQINITLIYYYSFLFFYYLLKSSQNESKPFEHHQ